MTPEIPQVLAGAALGLIYGLAGVARKHENGRTLSTKKIARRVVLFAVAGAMVAAADGDVTQAGIEAQVTVIGGSVGLAFDLIYERLRSEEIVVE